MLPPRAFVRLDFLAVERSKSLLLFNRQALEKIDEFLRDLDFAGRGTVIEASHQ